MTGASPRDQLLEAINALARSAHGGDHSSIEARRRDACALVLVHLRPPAEHPCPTCGIVCWTSGRLEEHLYFVHDGPRPAHWQEAERDA